MTINKKIHLKSHDIGLNTSSNMLLIFSMDHVNNIIEPNRTNRNSFDGHIDVDSIL
jgi:hypothetical protein